MCFSSEEDEVDYCTACGAMLTPGQTGLCDSCLRESDDNCRAEDEAGDPDS